MQGLLCVGSVSCRDNGGVMEKVELCCWHLRDLVDRGSSSLSSLLIFWLRESLSRAMTICNSSSLFDISSFSLTMAERSAS